jgi:hypothetical protein
MWPLGDAPAADLSAKTGPPIAQSTFDSGFSGFSACQPIDNMQRRF